MHVGCLGIARGLFLSHVHLEQNQSRSQKPKIQPDPKPRPNTKLTASLPGCGVKDPVETGASAEAPDSWLHDGASALVDAFRVFMPVDAGRMLPDTGARDRDILPLPPMPIHCVIASLGGSVVSQPDRICIARFAQACAMGINVLGGCRTPPPARARTSCQRVVQDRIVAKCARHFQRLARIDPISSTTALTAC